MNFSAAASLSTSDPIWSHTPSTRLLHSFSCNRAASACCSASWHAAPSHTSVDNWTALLLRPVAAGNGRTEHSQAVQHLGDVGVVRDVPPHLAPGRGSIMVICDLREGGDGVVLPLGTAATH